MRYRTTRATRAEASPNAIWRYRRRRRGSSDHWGAAVPGRGSGAGGPSSAEVPEGLVAGKLASSMKERSGAKPALPGGRDYLAWEGAPEARRAASSYARPWRGLVGWRPAAKANMPSRISPIDNTP